MWPRVIVFRTTHVVGSIEKQNRTACQGRRKALLSGNTGRSIPYGLLEKQEPRISSNQYPVEQLLTTARI